jgi:chorismate synthase
MPISDLDIHRAAHSLIQQHGDNAMAKAREMVEKMRRRGDADGAGVWLHIIGVIDTLGTPPTDARHGRSVAALVMGLATCG